MKKTTISILVAACALAAATAFAGDKDGKTKDWDAKMDAHFAEIDANGDGNISGDEFLAYKAAKAEEAWAKMAASAGDDGVLSLEEMKAHHKAMKAEKHDKQDHSNH